MTGNLATEAGSIGIEEGKVSDNMLHQMRLRDEKAEVRPGKYNLYSYCVVPGDAAVTDRHHLLRHISALDRELYLLRNDYENLHDNLHEDTTRCAATLSADPPMDCQAPDCPCHGEKS